jgi:hypothetical protein
MCAADVENENVHDRFYLASAIFSQPDAVALRATDLA